MKTFKEYTLNEEEMNWYDFSDIIKVVKEYLSINTVFVPSEYRTDDENKIIEKQYNKIANLLKKHNLEPSKVFYDIFDKDKAYILKMALNSIKLQF